MKKNSLLFREDRRPQNCFSIVLHETAQHCVNIVILYWEASGCWHFQFRDWDCFPFTGKTQWITKCLKNTRMREKGWQIMSMTLFVQQWLSYYFFLAVFETDLCSAWGVRFICLFFTVHSLFRITHKCFLLPGKILLLPKSPVWRSKKRNTGVQEPGTELHHTASVVRFTQSAMLVSQLHLLFRCRKDSSDFKPGQPVKRHSTDSKPDRWEKITLLQCNVQIKPRFNEGVYLRLRRESSDSKRSSSPPPKKLTGER